MTTSAPAPDNGPPDSTFATTDTGLDVQLLASALGAEVGREAGPRLLELSRAALQASASKDGSATSEFRLSVLLILAGLAMVALGAWRGDQALQQNGIGLCEVVGAGYAASRGLAKLGAGLGAKAK